MSPGPTWSTVPSANAIDARPESTTNTSSVSVSVLTPSVCDHTPTSMPGAAATWADPTCGSPETDWV